MAGKVRVKGGASGRCPGPGSAFPPERRWDAQSRAGSSPLPWRACGPGDGLVPSAGGQCVSPRPYHSPMLGLWRDDEAWATVLHLSLGTAHQGEGRGCPTQAPAGWQGSDEEPGSPGHPDSETSQLPPRSARGRDAWGPSGTTSARSLFVRVNDQHGTVLAEKSYRNGSGEEVREDRMVGTGPAPRGHPERSQQPGDQSSGRAWRLQGSLLRVTEPVPTEAQRGRA